jgi:hypothetical protein
MSRYLMVVLGLISFVPSAWAALDPELDKPYHLRVVLSMGENREFTPLFKDRVKRGLQDALQAALGNLGQVEVVDRGSLERELQAREPSGKDRLASLEQTLNLIEAVKEHGLKEALDTWKEVSEIKTHFVIIQSVDGHYEIQTRQFDGLTGLASPVVRQERTDDRELVVRTAALLIDHDLGIVGTVEANPRGPEVRVFLKGGALGSLTPWVGKGQVFAVAEIKQGTGGQRAFRVGETLLQVLEEPKQGVCRCRLLHRYENPLAFGPAVLGYRCLRLGTTKGELRIHLVDEKDRSPGVQRIRISGNDITPGKTNDVATNSDGFTPPLGTTYHHVAFVQILTGDTPLSGQIPVEILGDQVVVCRMHVDAKAEKSGRFEFDKKHLLLRLNDSLLAASGLVSELNQISKNPNARAEALQRAQAGLKDLQTDLTTYRQEQARLSELDQKLDLQVVREGLGKLDQKREEFQEYIASLERVIKEEKDPVRAELINKADQAKLLDKDAQYDQAIALYEEVVKKGANQPFIQGYAKRLEELKQEWELKSEKHRQARAFIYETWPKQESAAQLKARLTQAQDALKTFQEVGDRLSPRMLLKANTAHFNRLAKRLDAILASTSPEDREEGKIILEVKDGLVKLTDDAANFLKQAKK